MKKTFIAFATAATLLAVPVMAQDAADQMTIAVKTNDLDLTDIADQGRLDNRVEFAIRRACRSGGRDIASRQVEIACRANVAQTIAPSVELAIAQANTRHFASLDLNPGA